METTFTGRTTQEVTSSYDRARAEKVAEGYPAGRECILRPEKTAVAPGGGGGAIALIIGRVENEIARNF
jgi:hypothetical protein